MKLYFFTLLLVSVLLGSSLLANAQADGPAPAPAPAADICDEKCNVRCAKAGFYKRCYKYCYMCCSKCDYCVPSGTYGNRDECPCYRDMLNSKGKQKCP